MKKAVVIVAGGSGKRMGASIPKQFLELNGRPILMHTIERFYQFDPNIQIIVVLPAEERQRWEELCVQNNFDTFHLIAHGGSTRTESVQNGLQKTEDDCIVGIHDGVRPFVSRELLTRCYNEAMRTGNAIPVIAVSDTIREVSKHKSKTIDRSLYRLVQTPQCFQSAVIKDAYKINSGVEFTDDASVLEATGQEIHLCEGEKLNIKITVPADLILGEGILHATQKS